MIGPSQSTNDKGRSVFVHSYIKYYYNIELFFSLKLICVVYIKTQSFRNNKYQINKEENSISNMISILEDIFDRTHDQTKKFQHENVVHLHFYHFKYPPSNFIMLLYLK